MQFDVAPLNAYYDGRYSEREVAWRKICAVDKADHIFALIGGIKSDIADVLEVGCGTGDVIARIAAKNPGKRCVGIDVVDPELNNASVRSIPGLSFVRQEEETLPFEDHSFDLVFASHVLEHVEDERGFLRELTRVSRKLVFVEVPCELHLRASQASLQKTLEIGHINSYTPESFALTLATSGLNVLSMRCFDHSVAVQSFHSSRAKGLLKKLVRGGLLRFGERVASKVFAYHCAALCERA